MNKDNNKIDYIMRRLTGFVALGFGIRLCFKVMGWELFLIMFLFWFAHCVFHHVDFNKPKKKRKSKETVH